MKYMGRTDAKRHHGEIDDDGTRDCQIHGRCLFEKQEEEAETAFEHRHENQEDTVILQTLHAVERSIHNE